MEDNWWLSLPLDLQCFADSGDLQNFYSTFKRVYGQANRSLDPVRTRGGDELLKNKTQILDRWKEHYCELLNIRNPCDPRQLDAIPDRPIVNEMDICPSVEEIANAIRSLRNNKSPGIDGIPGEILKHGGQALYLRLHELISNVGSLTCSPTVERCQDNFHL